MQLRNIVSAVLLCTAMSATAQVSFGIGYNSPGVSIGINVPSYPNLIRVPGYPVYYSPTMNSNYFFYDGMYWVFQDDNWYASSWYNGPWNTVDQYEVPLFVLRIPVQYYRRPPTYFRGWQRNAAPRWGDHWGRDWEQQRNGWNRWDRRATPAPAPLPRYQSRYQGDRYPSPVERQGIHNEQYRYQPKEPMVRDFYRQQSNPGMGNGPGGPGRERNNAAPGQQNRGEPQRPNNAGENQNRERDVNRNDRNDKGRGPTENRPNDRGNDRSDKNDNKNERGEQKEQKEQKEPKRPQ